MEPANESSGETQRAAAAPARAVSDLIIVVETDPDHEGYDARFVSWVRRLQRAPRLPFPRQHGLSPAALMVSFEPRVVDGGALGRFEVLVRRGARHLANADGLARFVMPRGAELVVAGALDVGNEERPAWLDRRLAQQGIAAMSSRPRRLERDGAYDGDVLAQARDGRVGRVVTARCAHATLVLSLWANRERFEEFAVDVLVARNGLKLA